MSTTYTSVSFFLYFFFDAHTLHDHNKVVSANNNRQIATLVFNYLMFIAVNNVI